MCVGSLAPAHLHHAFLNVVLGTHVTRFMDLAIPGRLCGLDNLDNVFMTQECD